jgi:hypothetical protein
MMVSIAGGDGEGSTWAATSYRQSLEAVVAPSSSLFGRSVLLACVVERAGEQSTAQHSTAQQHSSLATRDCNTAPTLPICV